MHEQRAGDGVLRLQHIDITTLRVDAIVNAANAALAGGGGVDGAIHRAAGPSLMSELRERYDGCPTGSAVITGPGGLDAQYVIHPLGPRWRDGAHRGPHPLRPPHPPALPPPPPHRLGRPAAPPLR